MQDKFLSKEEVDKLLGRNENERTLTATEVSLLSEAIEKVKPKSDNDMRNLLKELGLEWVQFYNKDMPNSHSKKTFW